jgi:hypothetical protein
VAARASKLVLAGSHLDAKSASLLAKSSAEINVPQISLAAVALAAKAELVRARKTTEAERDVNMMSRKAAEVDCVLTFG